MKLEYIKANGKYYYPSETRNVCRIKKLMFGRWRVDYYDEVKECTKGWRSDTEDEIPNTRVILYPSGIEEIRYDFGDC